MKNNGLFSSLFIKTLKAGVNLDDNAHGRMATLAQTWRTRDSKDTATLWASFMKQAVSYLEFVPPAHSSAKGVYPLYDDYGYSKCVAVLYLIEPNANIDDTSVGHYYPAKLLAHLRERKLNFGILTDGATWRLYSTKCSRPYEDYVELPLSEALDGNDESEYGLFERFFHKDSFVPAEVADDERTKEAEAVGIYKCRLDQDKEQSENVLDELVKSPLLYQIDEVLQYLCNGFIHDTRKTGDEYTEEERTAIFESSVKLLYRCLFFFYAEAHHLLPSDTSKAEVYKKHSIQALCNEARKFRWGKRTDTGQYDLWKRLKGLVSAVNDGDPEYGIMGYNGGLFDDTEEQFLGQHQLRNDYLSRALYLLAYVEPYDNDSESEYTIPYEDLEVRHLGELYENILEYTVQLADADRFRRRTKKGVVLLLASQTSKQSGDTLIRKGEVFFGESALERKQTGSYYTPESLVRFLNEKTIIQPLRERFERTHRQRFDDFLDEALNGPEIGERRGATQSAVALVERFAKEDVLEFKVCDPAMGSGHFLVDVANQMAGLIVELLEEIPSFDELHVSVTSHPNAWRRLVTRHCLYGVDLNPLAVNLGKLSLWLNCFAKDHKLTFIDHHIRQGNSLIGLRSFNELKKIPKRKKDVRSVSNQNFLFDFDDLSEALELAAKGVASITEIVEDETSAQKEVFAESYEMLSKQLVPIADLYTAFLIDTDVTVEEYGEIFKCLAVGQPIYGVFNTELSKVWKKLQVYANRHQYFHWPLEFPDVFTSDGEGGFMAVVGNPPWDTWNPKTQEFFSSYDSSFRSLANKVAKVRAKELCEDANIKQAWLEYQSLFYEASYFFQNHADYAHQDIKPPGSNLYKLFLERDYHCLSSKGRLGLILPAGFYTDSATKGLRKYFIDAQTIDSIYCFENRFPTVFKSVDGRFKFITLSLSKSQTNKEIRCAFMQHDPDQLPEIEKRAIRLKPKDIVKFSPDSFSITEFNSQRDVDIASILYTGQALVGAKELSLPWTFPLLSVEFNMTHQSSMFQKNVEGYVLYEGKMINQFDHLFSKNNWVIETKAAEQYLASKEYSRIGRNTVLGKSIAQTGRHISISSSEYRFGVRSIAASTNERALISTVLPKDVCIANSLFTAIPWTYKKETIVKSGSDDRWRHANYSYAQLVFVVSLFNTFLYDWLTRMKISTNLNVFILNQLPMPRLTKESPAFLAIVGRALRLLCVSDDFSELWQNTYCQQYQSSSFWYPEIAPVDHYGPAHEQEIRLRLRSESNELTARWGAHCGVHNRLSDRRDTGDRAQLRAEIDAYVAHLFGIDRDQFSYVLDTFPVLRKKEEKAFGEFISKRKCLEEYDRLVPTLKERS